MRLNPANGYYVKSIDGLTGISASFESVKAISGHGESITRKTIQPKNLMITGLILDGNTNAKQELLDVLLAGEECLVTIYQGYINYSSLNVHGRTTPYRQTKAFVKSSPIITQENHSQFSFTLTMPNPYWEDVTANTVTVTSVVPNTAPTITGSVAPEFEYAYKTSVNSYGATLYCGTSLADAKHLYFNYTLLPNGYLPAGNTVHLWRENGRLRLTRTDSNAVTESIIEALYTNSTLWYLPVGNANKYWMSADGNFTRAQITYRPLYAGVLVDGV